MHSLIAIPLTQLEVESGISIIRENNCAINYTYTRKGKRSDSDLREEQINDQSNSYWIDR